MPNDTYLFQNVATLVICLLSIVHLNADTYRSFSILRKIQTVWLGKLANETIHSLMSFKFNIYGDCFDYKPPKDFLSNARKACNL